MNPSDEMHIWVKNGLEASLKMEQMLRDHKYEWSLGPTAALELWKAAEKFHICNTALRSYFEK